jgi:3-oxoacyl-[acyl-carrier protein] reductase
LPWDHGSKRPATSVSSRYRDWKLETRKFKFAAPFAIFEFRFSNFGLYGLRCCFQLHDLETGWSAALIKGEVGMILKGQIALITGASSGIGRATAEALAREGARVGVNYLKNQKGAEEAVDAIRKAGGEALAIRADVTRQQEVQSLVAAVRAAWGRIDILVNNAGDLIARRTLKDMTEEYWDQIMDLNLKSVFLCTQAVWQEMAARRSGCIINVSSIAGRNGGGLGAAAYAAAKGALLTYTKGLAKELAPHGIRVNGIAPGVIATPYHERFSPPELMAKFVANIPMGRAGTSEEIADVILFLASPAARYILGETVEVNGGMLMD